MKTWLFLFSILGLFLITAVALISSQVSFPIIFSPGKALNPKFYDYAGVTHVHSIYSTGSGNINEITKAANLAHCSFLVLTDLNPPSDLKKYEGYRDDVLFIVAGEYSYLAGHLLAYNLPEASHLNGPGQAQIFFNDLLEKKPRPVKSGYLVAAHPFLPQHSWDNILDQGLTGMEILNLDSLWHEEILQNKLSILWSFLILPFNADLSYLRLYTDPQKQLAQWDQILKSKPFVGFAGNDSTANAIPIPETSFQFPSYFRSFRLLKNHVLLQSELTGSFQEDRKKILDALGKGNFYFSIDLIGDPTGFYFVGQQKRTEVLPGQSLTAKDGTITLSVDLGHDVGIEHEILLVKNGQVLATSKGTTLNRQVKEPGAYRTMVRVAPKLPAPDGKKWITWIFSNAIRVE